MCVHKKIVICSHESTGGLNLIGGKKSCCYKMASPPAAVTLSAAAPAGGNGESVCRAARPRACAACSALRPATRAAGAAFSMVCVAHVQSGCAICNAAAWFSQQQRSGRWPDFLQTPPRVAPASARFLPLIIRFPWAISLHFSQAWSLASNWSCWFMLLLGWPRAHLHGCGMPGALSNSRAQRATTRQAAPAEARAPHACRPPCCAPPFTCRLHAASAAPRRTRSRRAPVAAATVSAIPALACHTAGYKTCIPRVHPRDHAEVETRKDQYQSITSKKTAK